MIFIFACWLTFVIIYNVHADVTHVSLAICCSFTSNQSGSYCCLLVMVAVTVLIESCWQQNFDVAAVSTHPILRKSR